MSVLGSAGNVGKRVTESEASMIPEGATGVVARGTGTGWSLVFQTGSGEVEVQVGDMERAVKLAMRLARVIEADKRK